MNTTDKTNSDNSILVDNSMDILPGEIIIGTVMNVNDQGQALVDFQKNPNKAYLIAVSTLDITVRHIGKHVALLFANGDSGKPIIMGIIKNPLVDLIDRYQDSENKNNDLELWPAETDVNKVQINKIPAQSIVTKHETTIDGERLVLEGKEEIVLRCGDASITLTKAGKILIRGKYLLSRSSGANQIMGGSVQLN